MIELGKHASLEVLRQAEQGLYLDGGPLGDILLPNRYVPEGTEVGDDLHVFLYCDSSDRPIATTEKPLAEAGQFAFLEVVQVNEFGAFLDWGLPKDLFVPFREQIQRMFAGNKYLVYVYLDTSSDRLLASTRLNRYLKKENENFEEGQEVSLIIGEETDLGFKVIIEESFWGMLYKNEIFRKIETGDKIKGFIKNIREDKLIDLSLQRQGYTEVPHSAQLILDKLKGEEGFLALTDKSKPEAIYEALQMSKKVFKKAVGFLYKQRLIRLEEKGIRLV